MLSPGRFDFTPRACCHRLDCREVVGRWLVESPAGLTEGQRTCAELSIGWIAAVRQGCRELPPSPLPATPLRADVGIAPRIGS